MLEAEQRQLAAEAQHLEHIADLQRDLQGRNVELTAALEVAHKKFVEAQCKAEGLEASKRELARVKNGEVARLEVEAREQQERRMRYVVSRMMGRNLDWAFDRFVPGRARCRALAERERLEGRKREIEGASLRGGVRWVTQSQVTRMRPRACCAGGARPSLVHRQRWRPARCRAT